MYSCSQVMPLVLLMLLLHLSDSAGLALPLLSLCIFCVVSTFFFFVSLQCLSVLFPCSVLFVSLHLFVSSLSLTA